MFSTGWLPLVAAAATFDIILCELLRCIIYLFEVDYRRCCHSKRGNALNGLSLFLWSNRFIFVQIKSFIIFVCTPLIDTIENQQLNCRTKYDGFALAVTKCLSQ